MAGEFFDLMVVVKFDFRFMECWLLLGCCYFIMGFINLKLWFFIILVYKLLFVVKLMFLKKMLYMVGCMGVIDFEVFIVRVWVCVVVC